MNLINRTARAFASLLALAAQAAPADRESVEQVLALSKAGAIVEASAANVGHSCGRPPRARRSPHGKKKIIDALPARFAEVKRSDWSWDKLKPQYVRIY